MSATERQVTGEASQSVTSALFEAQWNVTFIRKVVKIKLSLCLANEALHHEDVWGSGCIDPRTLDLDTSWESVVKFMRRSLYPRGKNPLYPLDARLSGPQSRSGRRRKEDILSLRGLEL
jgi:hypothetical protein